MARVKIAACAGGCGNPVWTGRGCLPAGEAMCQPCRRARWTAASHCARCGRALAAGKRVGRFCSRACSNRSGPRPHPCPGCGAQVAEGRAVKRCPPCQVAGRRANYRKKNTARRGVYPQGAMTMAELLERDGWRCHLCRKLIPRGVHYQDPQAPTFDHLIPVSAGGSDEPKNLAAAHRSCNSRRGAGGTVQLLLVG